MYLPGGDLARRDQVPEARQVDLPTSNSDGAGVEADHQIVHPVRKRVDAKVDGEILANELTAAPQRFKP